MVWFSIPAKREKGLQYMYWTWGLPPNTTQPDKDWVIHSKQSLCSFHSQKSSFQNVSFHQVLSQVVTRAVSYCDIQLLLQCQPLQKCLNWGIRGHTTPLLIGWLGLVKRASVVDWNETLSTSDRDHKSGAMGKGPVYTCPSSCVSVVLSIHSPSRFSKN